MKTLELNYHEFGIKFMVDKENNIKVNAEDMAVIFDKNVRDFTNLKSTKEFISICSENSKESILDTKSKSGILMDSILALKFASWLDISFEIWLHTTIEGVKFEHYNAHLKALTAQQEERNLFDKLCREAVYKQNELAIKIIESYRRLERFTSDKRNALRKNTRQVNNRFNLFNQEEMN